MYRHLEAGNLSLVDRPSATCLPDTQSPISEKIMTPDNKAKKTKGGQVNDKDRRENYILDISHAVKIDK